MGAKSVTGVSGPGMSGKFTTQELSILALGPAIFFTGTVATSHNDDHTSPPSGHYATITFPYALEGGSDKYVVMLTTISGGYGQVIDLDEDDDGNFTGFSLSTDVESTVMYLVVSLGSRPLIA